MSLGEIGENQGSWEETGNAPMIILRYMGSGMYERCDLELGRPYLSPKGKEDTYKDNRNRSLDKRESERNIVPKMAVKQNTVYERFLTSFKFVERVSVRECHED